MSYSQEIANQASGFSNFGQQYAERGQNAINDFNIEQGEYNGAEVAHRNGIAAVKTGAELPRLAESFMLKPLGKKLVNYAGKKLGISDKVEGITKTATALKEGRYGDAASAAAETAGVSVPKDVDAIIQKGGKGVRQLGSDRFKSMSENARGKMARGTVDEGGIPYNSKDFSANDVRKGIQQGRLKVNKDDSITDNTTGETHTPPSVEGLKGGAKVKFEGGQARLEDESGHAWSADQSFGGGEAAPSSAYKSIQRGEDASGFQGSAETQGNLDRITAAKDAERGSVDFRASGRKVEDPQSVADREARIEKVSGKQARTEGAAPAAEDTRPPPARSANTATAEPTPANVRLQESIGRNTDAQASAAKGAESGGEAAARSTTTEGGYSAARDAGSIDQLAPMREMNARLSGGGQGAEGRLSGRGATTDAQPTAARPPASARTEAGQNPGGRANDDNLPQSLIEKSKGRQAPDVVAKPDELPTSTSTYATKTEGTISKAGTVEKEVAQGAETIGKSVGESEVKTAAADEIPGLGEVVMGLSAAWGLVKGAVKEHQEIKGMKADAPAPPPSAAASVASQPRGGISFNAAPVIDSDSYHHL